MDPQVPHPLPKEGECWFCMRKFEYAALRKCFACNDYFCLKCAPSLQDAVLQCCNMHSVAIWFCSAFCRHGKNADTVRQLYIFDVKCED